MSLSSSDGFEDFELVTPPTSRPSSPVIWEADSWPSPAGWGAGLAPSPFLCRHKPAPQVAQRALPSSFQLASRPMQHPLPQPVAQPTPQPTRQMPQPTPPPSSLALSTTAPQLAQLRALPSSFQLASKPVQQAVPQLAPQPTPQSTSHSAPQLTPLPSPHPSSLTISKSMVELPSVALRPTVELPFKLQSEWPASDTNLIPPPYTNLMPPSTNLLKRELEEARGRQTVGRPALRQKLPRLGGWLPTPPPTPPRTVRVRPPAATLTQHVFSLAGVLTSEQWRLFEREVSACVAAMAAAGPVAAQVSITRAHVARTLLGYSTTWTDITVRADARVSSARVSACMVDVLGLCGIKDAQDALVGASAR